MLVNDYLLDDDPYETEWVRQVRKSAIFFFALSIILVLVSHYAFLKYSPEDYAAAQASFLNGRMDSWDLIFIHMAIPCLYFGWNTITKVLDHLFGARGYRASIAIVIVYYIFRAIASLMLGFILFPVLVIFNLIKLLLARPLSRNRIVQYFS